MTAAVLGGQPGSLTGHTACSASPRKQDQLSRRHLRTDTFPLGSPERNCKCETCRYLGFVVLPTVLTARSRSLQTIACSPSAGTVSQSPRAPRVTEGASGSPVLGEFPKLWKEDTVCSGKTSVPALVLPPNCCVTLGRELHFCESVSSSGIFRWQQTMTVPPHIALMLTSPLKSKCILLQATAETSCLRACSRPLRGRLEAPEN